MHHRWLLLCFVALIAGSACSDSKSKPPAQNAEDAGPGDPDAGGTAREDAGQPQPASALPRPGLERPPTGGLPPELRPPR